MGDGWVRLLSGNCPVDDFVDSLVGRDLTEPILIAVLMLIIASGLLRCWLVAGREFDHETRCRKCGYLLRGISEPRCRSAGNEYEPGRPVG